MFLQKGEKMLKNQTRVNALLNPKDQNTYEFIWSENKDRSNGGVELNYYATVAGDCCILNRDWFYFREGRTFAEGKFFSGGEQINFSRKELHEILVKFPISKMLTDTLEVRYPLKNLGNFDSRVVPEAAKNRIRQVTELFSGNDKAAYAIFGVYIVVIAYIGDRWYMKFCTTTHKKGTDQMWERSERISRVLSDLGNSQLKQAIERFMSGK